MLRPRLCSQQRRPRCAECQKPLCTGMVMCVVPLCIDSEKPFYRNARPMRSRWPSASSDYNARQSVAKQRPRSRYANEMFHTRPEASSLSVRPLRSRDPRLSAACMCARSCGCCVGAARSVGHSSFGTSMNVDHFLALGNCTELLILMKIS
eukprot:COSAG02_NODE_2299_length_9190_cov_122.517655_10_plen_151_part_00